MSFIERVEDAKRLLGTLEQTKPMSQPAKSSAPSPIEYLKALYLLLSYQDTGLDLRSAILGTLRTPQGLLKLASAINIDGLSGERLVELLRKANVPEDCQARLLTALLIEARQGVEPWLAELINMVIGGEGKAKTA
ncbi:hypothetical protein [Caldivirga sp. MU80]|uniref:hypothetical protein n=1 Tax=Caldivirga sp. MU80 TaxID=1650354 RepID=UPI0012E71304|nr:hypothetical protein [Caldivirga sp. MU80]